MSHLSVCYEVNRLRERKEKGRKMVKDDFFLIGLQIAIELLELVKRG